MSIPGYHLAIDLSLTFCWSWTLGNDPTNPGLHSSHVSIRPRKPHLSLHAHASEIIPTPTPTVACPPEKFYAIVLRTPLSARIESYFYCRAKDMASQKSQARHEVILCMRMRPSLPLLAQNSKWSAGFPPFVYPHRPTVNSKHRYSPRSVWGTKHTLRARPDQAIPLILTNA